MQSNALDTQITLSGDEEVKKQFQEIVRVGQAALDKLKASSKDGLKLPGLEKGGEAAKFTEALEGLSGVLGGLPGLFGEVTEPLSLLSELFGKLTTGVGGFAVAGAAAITALYGISKAASDATVATADAARATGLTVEEYESLRFAAATTGVGMEDFTRAIERFAVSMGEARQSAEQARKNYQDALPTLDQLAIKQREVALAAATTALQIKQSANAVVVAQHSYEAATRGLVNAKTALGDLQQRYAQQLQDTGRGDPALAKQIDDQLQAVKDAQFNKDQVRQQELDRQEQNRIEALKVRLDYLKRIEEAKEKQQQLDDKRDEKDKDANKRFTESVAASFTGGGVANTYKALGEFSDRFKSLTNEVDRAALASSVFGKNWASLVGWLDLGSAKLNELGKELEELKIQPDGWEKWGAQEFQKQEVLLRQTIEGARNALGNILGQLLSPGFKVLSSTITNNMNEIRATAWQLVNFLTPVFKAVGDIVGAAVRSIVAATDLLNAATGSKLSAALIAISGALLVVAPEITLLVGALTVLHEVLQAYFGPQAADLFLPLTAGIMAVAKAFSVLRTAMAGLAVVSAPILLLVAAVAAVGAAVWIVYGNVDKFSEVVGRVFGQDAKQAFDTFVTNLREMVDRASAWFRDSFLGRMVQITIDSVRNMIGTFRAFAEMVAAIFDWIWESYKNGFLGKFVQGTIDAIKYLWGWWVWLNEKLDEAWGKLKRVLGGGTEANAQAGTEQTTEAAHAQGGQVQGPGGVDTVRIRATAGEFVHRVAAVRHYGADFMNRVNNLQVPKGFALGGLVGGFADMVAGPRGYAGGGMVSPTRGSDGPMVAVDLSHGGQHFGVLAPAAVADRLVTHSRREQMKSAGRKPDWFGGA